MIISPSASAQSASDSSDSAAGVAFHDPHVGAEDLALEFVGLLAGFGIQNGNRHRVPS